MPLNTKVGELEGARHLMYIKCSCGAEWRATGDKKVDRRERPRFIAKHAGHQIEGMGLTTRVRKA